MAGSEALERWNSVHIPDDMPITQILRKYVVDVCGINGYGGPDMLPDPCDVIGLLWGAVYGLEERLVDSQRRVDALAATNERDR